jgi:uncharacterized repeat protein (TIGR03803 family)
VLFPHRNYSRSYVETFVVCLFLLVTATQPLLAQTFTVLHSFSGLDGAVPHSGLTLDAAGNLYGTTFGGGNEAGTVFKLTHTGSGWVLNPLYRFLDNGDGASPAARVVFGRDGALYGTTYSGRPAGVVYKLQPPVSFCRAVLCPWTETVLYTFSGGADGDTPAYGPVVFDPAGALYGTTLYGGSGNCGGVGCGTVYKLSRSGNSWIETVVHNFLPQGDGHEPESGLAFDSAGNLYGTTGLGCAGNGCVYRLAPSGSDWIESVIYSFTGGSDGGAPAAGLIFDRTGKVYGATPTEGPQDGGTIFQMTASEGNWQLSTIYGMPHGIGPQNSLVTDASGNLYGTTTSGGAHGYGTVFKLASTGGGWNYTSLHDFTGGSDGGNPQCELALGTDGVVYGTASTGGDRGLGVVFEIAP